MAQLLSDADVGFKPPPALLSDADVGFKPVASAQDTGIDTGPPQSVAQPPATPETTAPAPASSAGRFLSQDRTAPEIPAEQGMNPATQPVQSGSQDAIGHTALARIAAAAREGWENSPASSPEGQYILDKSGWGGITRLLDAGMGVSNAAVRGVQESAMQIGNEIGMPRAGREVAGFLEYLLTGQGVPHIEGPAGYREGAAEAARNNAATPRPAVQDVLNAGSVDDAIGAAAAVAGDVAPTQLQREQAAIGAMRTPPTNAPAFVPPGSNVPVLPRILDLIRADDATAAGRPDFVPPDATQPDNPLTVPQPRVVEPALPGDFAQTPLQREQAAVAAMRTGQDASALPGDAPADPEPASAGAAASREQTPQAHIEASPAEAAANRAQGEIERFATPPRHNDATIYIPGTKPTLAEVTGDPRTAMDQAYNRQQPEAMQSHIAQENHNAEAVADYYADTAGSAQTLARMERARDERAQQNIQRVFGDPQSTRPPADPGKVIGFMDDILADPRMQERNIIRKTIPDLIDRFYNEDGSVKTDPLSLYGIRQHIQDLLNGAGDPETNAAARMLRRELMQIQGELDNAIEAAAPGFAQYRADYTRDSREIDAMRLLQSERLPLLNKDLHITPAKWFSFMKGVIEGRTDPMDPASALSEEQMDRLWNITDQLKRQTFVDAGHPRGSWTSMMQEWGGRFARLGAHGLVATHFPVVGNLGIEMGIAQLRKRSVTKEMNRVLNPDLGAPP